MMHKIDLSVLLEVIRRTKGCSPLREHLSFICSFFSMENKKYDHHFYDKYFPLLFSIYLKLLVKVICAVVMRENIPHSLRCLFDF